MPTHCEFIFTQQDTTDSVCELYFLIHSCSQKWLFFCQLQCISYVYDKFYIKIRVDVFRCGWLKLDVPAKSQVLSYFFLSKYRCYFSTVTLYLYMLIISFLCCSLCFQDLFIAMCTSVSVKQKTLNDSWVCALSIKFCKCFLCMSLQDFPQRFYKLQP